MSVFNCYFCVSCEFYVVLICGLFDVCLELSVCVDNWILEAVR